MRGGEGRDKCEEKRVVCVRVRVCVCVCVCGVCLGVKDQSLGINVRKEKVKRVR